MADQDQSIEARVSITMAPLRLIILRETPSMSGSAVPVRIVLFQLQPWKVGLPGH